jgi:hypothetical protein
LRIPAVEVLKNMDGAVAHILHCCANRPLHQPPAGPPPRSGEDL